ncbi:MAG: 5-formyltetrahydrofolate cyclo-ligase [Lachnospiraceae bacterium]|nr:5-formyltetrahydrofolate cyclo-ligase [Lachnospiraceae bacterium]
MVLKKEIRKLHKAKRDAIPLDLKTKAEEEIAEILRKKLSGETVVFVYSPKDSELNLWNLYDSLMKNGVRLAFPRVNSNKYEANKDMEFYVIKDKTDLEPGTFGVMEPKKSCDEIIPADNYFLVPGLAFDLDGSRIGYGAGYYDRYFGKYDNHKKIGVCFRNQITEHIDSSLFDIRMDEVICDSCT